MKKSDMSHIIESLALSLCVKHFPVLYVLFIVNYIYTQGVLKLLVQT